MAEYVRIIDGIVQTSQPLPENYQTSDGTWITGFKHMSDDELANHGFFKVVMPDVEYDPETQDVAYFENILNEDGKTVSPRYEIRDKTTPETASDVLSSLLGVSNLEVKPIKDDFTDIPPRLLNQMIGALTKDPNSVTPETTAEEL